MPRLSKIRLTGCKYDGLRKEHENSIFDLNTDGWPDHTLFTLKNGGGKGVMMQLIFQLLLPNTKWGKNNGNQVISMFYDKKNRLHPFTFHVVLEWLLDTSSQKRLITGIGIKSVLKNISGEDEDQAGLSYILYTHEHDNKGFFSVENLPLYDAEKKAGIDLKYLEDFLGENRRDFVKYGQSSGRNSGSDYYKYLESMGIYKTEWLNLKAINKSEGGISENFSNASDNIGIFDKVIIPAISENIRNYSGEEKNTLVDMFRANLSITKDLPTLLKREGDFKTLLLDIEPLIQNADSGSRFMDRSARLIGEGNDILYILRDEESIVKADIEKWSLSLDRAKEERDQLNFEKDNLDYNKLRIDLEEKELRLKDYQEELGSINKDLEVANEDLILYRINKLLYGKKEIEKEIENERLEKNRLIENLEIVDLEDRMKDLEDELLIEWDKLSRELKNTEINYMGYKNYLKALLDGEKNKKNRYLDKRRSHEKDLMAFELEEKELVRRKERLEEYYDPMSLSFPERILENLTGLKEDEVDLNNNIRRKISGIEEEIASLRTAINKNDS